ncbi:MAG: hypothetical protein CVV33_10640 [Methanomicrobiales archaeon HGW-Methanomicrobiales-4]|nr:MAG: hypothetical protein CVV33_10640 [Methanomicrobiales archaeon HGW-Methanomicrobiales-4]
MNDSRYRRLSQIPLHNVIVSDIPACFFSATTHQDDNYMLMAMIPNTQFNLMFNTPDIEFSYYQ